MLAGADEVIGLFQSTSMLRAQVRTWHKAETFGSAITWAGIRGRGDVPGGSASCLHLPHADHAIFWVQENQYV